MDLTLNRWKAFLIVLLIWAAIYLPSLGKPEFKGEEGRRVMPAITMLQTGNWIVPSVGGEDYHSKPPGINWLVALSFALTGQQTELAARLPSAFFTLAFVSLLIWMPNSYLGLSGRLIAAIVFLTNIKVIEKGRLIEIEGVYIALTGLATLWWINSWSRNSSRWALWIVPSIIIGFGMLVKGPFILIFFYCTVIAVLWYGRKVKDLFAVQHIAGIALFSIMVLGWLYLAYQHTDSDKMTSRMTSQLLIRILPRNIKFINRGAEVIEAFLNFLPWLLFVPILWDKKLVSRIAPEHTALFKGCRLGLVISFAIINLMPGAQSRYSLPAFPLASLLVGWAMSLREGFTRFDRFWKNVLLGGILIICPAAITGLFTITRTLAAFVVTALAVCAAVIVFRKRDLLRGTLSLTLATAAVIVVIMLQYAVFGVTLVTRYENRRPAAAMVNNAVPSDQIVYVFKPGYQAFLYYVRPPVKYLLEDDQVTGDVHYLLLKQEDWERLENQPHILSRTPKILCRLPDSILKHFRLVKLE